MSTQIQTKPPRIPKRRGRGLLVWLARIVAGVLGLAVIGAVWESTSEAADARAYPPPGQMVDVGGYRLHIDCTGTGSPTVVIDAGWGDWSSTWKSWVQPGVEKTTRVCTYDRAGMGYSEAGPLPRNAAQFTKELHTLLQRASIPGPYVLVGHSMGGLTVRVFAHEYPAEVAGVVLIDSMSPGQANRPVADTEPQASSQPSGLGIVTLPARIGLIRLLAVPLGLEPVLSPEVQHAHDAYSVSPRFVQTYLDEGMGMPESLAQAGTVKTFGDLPLIVLSRGLDPKPEWQADQAGLLQLSSHSEQLFADKSDHSVEVNQPDAAVGAIVRMVEQVRKPMLVSVG